VEATDVRDTLEPYNDQGGDLFPEGSVEVNWYQWDGFYVALYRGWDAEADSPICAGNSILTSAGLEHVSNSPHMGAADDVCSDVPKLADPPAGVYACGSLLYYRTEIPVTADGELFGTLEFNDGSGFAGQTASGPADPENTPEFPVGESAYQLPPSEFDDLGTVACGE
jgi:hypothetical protein